MEGRPRVLLHADESKHGPGGANAAIAEAVRCTSAGGRLADNPHAQDHQHQPERQANRPLVEALAKAHRWQAQLESGEHASLDDLAHAHGVDRSYVGRLLRLTSLAPDLVEAILRGDEPNGISLEKLRKHLPVRWEEQRERWGTYDR